MRRRRRPEGEGGAAEGGGGGLEKTLQCGGRIGNRGLEARCVQESRYTVMCRMRQRQEIEEKERDHVALALDF